MQIVKTGKVTSMRLILTAILFLFGLFNLMLGIGFFLDPVGRTAEGAVRSYAKVDCAETSASSRPGCV